MHDTRRPDGLHISVSQLKSFIRCSRAYELKYVRGEAPAFVPLPLAFGSAFHSGLAQFYGHLKLFGTPAPLEEMTQAFRDTWEKFVTDPVPIGSGEDKDDIPLEQQVDKAVQMLTVFREFAVAQALPAVHAVEFPFTVALHDPDTGEELDEKLTGFMDLVTGPEDGRYTSSSLQHRCARQRSTLGSRRGSAAWPAAPGALAWEGQQGPAVPVVERNRSGDSAPA